MEAVVRVVAATAATPQQFFVRPSKITWGLTGDRWVLAVGTIFGFKLLLYLRTMVTNTVTLYVPKLFTELLILLC